MTDLPRSGEVWLIRFKFLDKPEITKVRPAIVISFDGIRLLTVAAKVTSHEPREGVPGELRLLDWRDAGLDLPSCVRCSQIIEVPASLLLRKLGTLSANDRTRLRDELRFLGAIG